MTSLVILATLLVLLAISTILLLKITHKIKICQYVERKEHDQRFITGNRKGYNW